MIPIWLYIRLVLVLIRRVSKAYNSARSLVGMAQLIGRLLI